MTGAQAVVSERVDGRRRLAAVLALVTLAVALVAVLFALEGQVLKLLASLAAVLVLAGSAWVAVTRRGGLRLVGSLAAVAALVAIVVLVLTGEAHGLALLVVVLMLAASAALTRYALRRDRRSLVERRAPGTEVTAARKGVLIMNLKSGGGKAERFHLADECRRRGIEPVVLEPGLDLLALAEDAVARGADVIGMAGGDGSQALVASVAMRHDVALVCIPAGTRNHFALDLGLDRDDVVGALDAFGPALERRIDLATVNGRVFVNNVSLGVYAKVVQSPEYRDAKGKTTADMLPELLGPDAPSFGMAFTAPDGTVHADDRIIQVSNNPYVLTRLLGFGTRARLDTGELGVVSVTVTSPADVAALVAAETAGRVQRFRGWTEFTTSRFVVTADSPVESGVDGEALVLEPPLEFVAHPGAVRIRIPLHAPGWSPAALVPPSRWWTLKALVRTVAGRPTPIDESAR